MAFRVRDAIIELDMDALRRLADNRGLRSGRSRDEKLEALARSYRGDFAALFEECRNEDLVNMLNCEFTTSDDLCFEFKGLNAASKDDLIELAEAVFVTDWEPDEDADGNIAAGSITVRVWSLEDEFGDDDDESDDDEDDADDEVDEGDDDADDDEDAAGSDEDSDTDWPEPAASTEAWRLTTDFPAGPGVVLPDGLSASNHELAAHQVRSVDALHRWWNLPEKRSGILCLPTGAGKTRVASRFVIDLLGREKSVLWLTHRAELMDQAISAFLTTGHQASRNFKIARFGRKGARGELKSDVVVGMVTSLAWSRDDELPNLSEMLELHGQFDLVVVDECHHSVASTWKRVLKGLRSRCHHAKILGLSATPTRTAKTERAQFWKVFGEVIHEERPLELMKAGVLAQPVLHTVETQHRYQASAQDVLHARKFKELSNRLVVEISRDVGRNELVAKTFTQDAARWGKSIIFAGTREQGRELTSMLRRDGVQAFYVDGTSGAAERDGAVESFRQPAGVQVLVNVGLFTEGTDLPGAASVFIARPTQSQILFQQMVGRGLRGPAFGGTTKCNVVTFHDDVLGLFESGLLQGYGYEAETLLELGMQPEDEPTVAEPTKPFVSLPVILREKKRQARIAHETSLLRQALMSRGPGQDATPARIESELSGWWEIGGTKPRWYPIFSEEQATTAQVMGAVTGYLASGLGSGRGPSDFGIDPGTVMAEFAQAALDHREAPRWISMANASVQQARSMANVGNIAPATELAPVEPGKLPAVVAAQAPVPSMPASATPPETVDWVKRARSRIQDGTDLIVLRAAKREVRLTSAQHTAATDFWTQKSAGFIGKSEQAVRERIDTMAEFGALPSSVDREDLLALIAHAVSSGTLPVAEAETTPSMTDVARSVKSLPAAERPAALNDLRSAYFGPTVSAEEFLVALTNELMAN